MTPRKLTLAAAAAAVLAAGAFHTAPARAEVYAVPSPSGFGSELRIAPAGNDGKLPWTPLGLAPDSAFVLNPGGDSCRDEAPVVAFDSLYGYPYVAWAARNPGGDRDIRVAYFDGTAWTDLGTVRRETARDDVAPAILIVDGAPVIAWVERAHDKAKSSSVWYVRHTGGSWTAPVLASPAGGSWLAPSLLLTTGDIILGCANAAKHGDPAIQMLSLPRYPDSGTNATDGPMPVPPGLQGPTDGHGGGGSVTP
jgi:hypothetical protein